MSGAVAGEVTGHRGGGEPSQPLLNQHGVPNVPLPCPGTTYR